MRRVVITGMGAVTPVGNSVPEAWEAVKQGVSGIAPITRFNTENFSVKVAAEVKEFHPETLFKPADLRKMDLYTVYALYAAEEAVKDAGIKAEEEPDTERLGVIISSGIGGIGTFQANAERGLQKGFDRVSPHFIPITIVNMAAGQAAIRFGFHGLCSSVVTACAGGTNAVGDAFRQIKDGYHDVMLCGGAEAACTPMGIGGFASMKAVTTTDDPSRASIPFDKERSGFVLGEGAGILVLEEYEHAVKRGAKIYCEVTGYGVSCDAYHITAPDPSGSMAAACMRNAMKEAGVGPEEVDYINAHGTSTQLNDSSETKAVRLAFGEAADHLMMSSTKSMTGHLLGAAGAVEAIFTAMSLKEGIVPPTINYKVPDEACDLDIVPNEARKADIRTAMSNSLGFGGHNASLIFRKV